MKKFSEIKRDAALEIAKLMRRGAGNVHNNEQAGRTDNKKDPSRETMSERMFVRAFGSKAKRVRYSNRADFVGLMIMGTNIGFIVMREKNGKRKLRVLERDPVSDRLIITNQYRELKSEDSLTNLQRGLLNWVQ